MATVAEMDLVIGANVSGAVAGLTELNAAEKILTLSSEILGKVMQSVLTFGIAAVTAAATDLVLSLFKTNEATKKTAEEQKKFAESLDKASASALETGLKLQSFINIAKDSKEPLETRNEALREANKIMGEHGEKLTLANVATKEITEQTKLFTEALINQAIAAKYADKIADLTIKQTNLSRQYGEQLEKTNKATKEANDLSNIAGSGTGGIGGAGNINAVNKAASEQGKLVKITNDYKETTKDLIQLTGDYTSVTEKAVSALGHIGTKTKEATDENKKLEESLWKIHLRTQELEKTAFVTPLWEAIKLTPSVVKATDSVRDYFKAYQEGQKKLEEFKKQKLDDVTDFLGGEGDKTNDKINKRIADRFDSAMKAAQELQSVFSDVFSSLQEGGQAAIKALIHSLEQLIVKLAAAAAAAALISLIPGGGSFASIFSELTGLKGLFGGAHAAGGIVTSAQFGLIGEAGPEAIIPLDRLREFMQSPNQAIVLETRVRGDDLYLIQSRTAQRRGRAY